MIFFGVLFAKMRENLLSTFSGLVGKSIFLCKIFQDWLVKNLLLKANSALSSTAVLGLKTNFFFITRRYFYFLVAYNWTCRVRETTTKIKGFPSFLSTFTPTEIIPKHP